MTTLKVTIIAIVALVIGLGAGYVLDHQPSSQVLAGAVNARPAENYDPYLRTNGGYYSLLPIQTTSSITAASETITGISTTATTSVTKLCVSNGTNYTVLTFAANSTSTASFATSTTCQ